MTTTQIQQAGAASHVFGATVSVINASPNISDSAHGFTTTDVGRAVTTANTSGRSILSITDDGHAVMDGNATASSGPQTLTLAAVLMNVVKTTGNHASRTTPYVSSLAAGRESQSLYALNIWINCGGVGEMATLATKVLAAQGLLVQET